jgi:4-phosphopantoate--beta-alanine ligase
MKRTVSPGHPRFLSLATRERIVAGVETGITSIHGLIAHGRGEAFDYLLGETTHGFARTAINAGACLLLRAEHPVISVNGNSCALAAPGLVLLGKLTGASLEVNIFHPSKERERAIRDALREAGADSVLLPSRRAVLAGLDHNRRFVNPGGIAVADVVFVPLEDGDRCQALRAAGKSVITVDLNPLSRTARTASVTIVDNLVRCLPLLCNQVIEFQKKGPSDWAKTLSRFRNQLCLDAAEQRMRRRATPNPSLTPASESA